MVTCALFAGYLFSDGFGDARRGDGTRTFRPGYVALLLQIDSLQELVLGRSGWTLVLVPILLCQLAFFALPILFFTGVLNKPRPNRALRRLFLSGACAYACLLWLGRFNPPQFGAYLWLMAAMTAVECLASCVTPEAKSLP